MTIHSILAFSAAMAVLAASPGPGVFAAVAHALSGGFRAGLDVIAGIVVGDLLFLMLAVFGMAAVAHVLGEFFLVIKLLGGAYLIFMGLRMWASHYPRPAPDTVADPGGRGRRFLAGLFITLGNPKVILFYCGFLPSFMDLTRLTAGEIAVAGAVVASVLSGVLGTYAYGAGRARRLFAGEGAARRFNRGAGTVLIGTGVVIATR